MKSHYVNVEKTYFDYHIFASDYINQMFIWKLSKYIMKINKKVKA